MRTGLKLKTLTAVVVISAVFAGACGGGTETVTPVSEELSLEVPSEAAATAVVPIASRSVEAEPTPPAILKDEPPMILVPGRSTLRIDQVINGEMVPRSFVVHAPREIDPNRRYAVLMAFHGYGGGGGLFEYYLSRFVESGEFIGIYPEGIGPVPAWNVGNGVSTVDDLEFVGKIIEVLTEYDELELSEMYAVGISTGAGLVHILAGNTEYFTRVTMIATQLQVDWEPDPIVAPVSVLQISGMRDATIPYEGGESSVGTFYPAEESARIWALHDMCNGTPTISSTEYGNRKLVFSDCDAGTRVVHYGITDGGHDLPDDTEGGLYDLVWSFFADESSN